MQAVATELLIRHSILYTQKYFKPDNVKQHMVIKLQLGYI